MPSTTPHTTDPRRSTGPSRRWLLPALCSAALLASPMAFAGHHGHGDHSRGKPSAETCERFQDGREGRHQQRWQQHRERMNERHAEVAERLELTPAQRQTWDTIRDEQQAKWQERMAERQDRMRERCQAASDQQ